MTSSSLRSRRWAATATAGAVVAGSLAAAVATPSAASAAPAPAAQVLAAQVLAKTPVMGFNDWNSFGCNVTEQLITATADYFVTSGLKDAGYTYVDIDDCWSLKQRGAQGQLVADPVKFPHGMAWLADYVHSKGLKIGSYSSAGDLTCAGYPASFGHERQDAALWASWGIDLLKYDNCGARTTPETQAGFITRYKAMGDALKATGRSIVYSLCEWGQQDVQQWGPDMAQMWRTTGDISDNWASLKGIIAQNVQLAQYARPGHFNDPDMLEVGNGGMTDTEYRTHFAMWSVMAAPLLIGTDLRKASPETLKILTNRELIAVDQDPLGVQGQVIARSGDTTVLSKPLANGDRAVALYNAGDSAATISTTTAQAGLPKSAAYRTKDLWSGKVTETAGQLTAVVPAHGTAVYRVHGITSWTAFLPATSFGVSGASGYPGADVALGAGTSATFTSTLGGYGRDALKQARVTAEAPAGWTLTHTSPWTQGTVWPGTPLRTTWTLTAPAGTPAGSYPVDLTATYDYGTGKHGSQSTRALAQVLPAAPSGTNALSDLTWVSASNAWGPVEKDTSNGEAGAGDGGPITIAGTRYAKGLGVHAPSDVTYYLGGACSSFTSKVGIDDEVSQDGKVVFQVYAGDAKVADSGEVTHGVAAKTVTADLTGATWLRLHVDDDGGNGYDHSDWAAPVLTCS